MHHKTPRWLCRVTCILLMLLMAGCGGSADNGNTDNAAPQDREATFSFSPVKWLLALAAPIRPEQPDTVKSLEEQAARFAKREQFELAEKHYRQALLIRDSAWGEDSEMVIPGLTKLAAFYSARDRHAEAEPLLQRALAIMDNIFGSQHADLPAVLEQYATLLRQTQRDVEAIPLEARAREMRDQQ